MDEELLLALLNTAPRVDGVLQDQLADAAGARAWLRAHGGDQLPVTELRAGRAALQAVIRGDEPATVLEPFLAGVTSRPSVSADGVEWTLDGGNVLVRAILAWEGLRASGRLRPCENTECQLFLIDRSKANNARWCSMAVCGNRMKARRHYQRVRGK
jgi:hypothetical protein